VIGEELRQRSEWAAKNRLKSIRGRAVGGDWEPGPTKTGSFTAPSATLVAEKEHFGSSRRERWFRT
jgi:hypothetical protein